MRYYVLLSFKGLQPSQHILDCAKKPLLICNLKDKMSIRTQLFTGQI